jgi:hypothetical protein
VRARGATLIIRRRFIASGAARAKAQFLSLYKLPPSECLHSCSARRMQRVRRDGARQSESAANRCGARPLSDMLQARVLRHSPHDSDSDKAIMKSDLSKSGWAADPASGLDVVSGLLGCAAGEDLAGGELFGPDPISGDAAPSLPATPEDKRDQKLKQQRKQQPKPE